MRENKDFNNKFENEASELRINYRIKSEELERLRIDSEDKNAELRGLKDQNEMLKDKIAILRSEFFKAEAKSKDQNADLKAKCIVMEEKLKNYDNIERDIDEAVMGLGSTTNPDQNHYLQTIQMAPSSTQRRVQQSLNLAQKLNQKQLELEKLRAELNSKKGDLQRAEEELAMTQDLLSKTKHPSGYLIESLESKERENMALKQDLARLKSDCEVTKSDLADCQAVGIDLS